MPYLHDKKNGSKIMRMTLFARWGWTLKSQWIQVCINIDGVIAVQHCVLKAAPRKNSRHIASQEPVSHGFGLQHAAVASYCPAVPTGRLLLGWD